SLEEIMPPAGDTKKTWQLRHGDGEASPNFETDKDAVAYQLNERAQPKQPSQKAQSCHGERCKTCYFEIALRVAIGHCPDGSGNHERNGGSRSNGKLARRPKQGIAQSA